MAHISNSLGFTIVILLISSMQSLLTYQISTDPSYYYDLCAPSACNNLTLRYPLSLPTPCHIFPTTTSCPNNRFLLLDYAKETFRILSVDYINVHTVKLVYAANSLFTCGSHISKPDYSMKYLCFTIPANYTLGTHFNCTAPIPSGLIKGLQNASCLGCEGQDPSNVCYYALGAYLRAPNCETFEFYGYSPGGLFNASSKKDLRSVLQTGFELTYNKHSECQGCENSGGRCGATPSSETFVCFCPSSAHPSNCTDGVTIDISTWRRGPEKKRNKLSIGLVAGTSTISLLLAVGVIVLLVVTCFRKRNKKIHFDMETLSTISPTRYSYSQIKKFTKNFSSKVGEGGFGVVYKGSIRRGGSDVSVAIKILKRSKQTTKQFMNEVATIGSIHHHNLVSLLGYCVEGENHALVYEYLENGSLDKYIYSIKKENNDKPEVWLTYKQVYNICLETAKGISYLHNGCSKKILHCDIKPPNILLDSNFSAKIADFGLAKIIDKDHSHVSRRAAQGTPGYTAPEVWLKTYGPVTDKSDVYSYGMLVLEMVSRRKNYSGDVSNTSQVYFPEWVYDKVNTIESHVLLWNNNCVEEETKNEEEKEMIHKMCLIGLWCIQHNPSNRPSMEEVIQMLEGSAEIGMPPYPFLQQTNHLHQSTSVRC